MSPSRTMVARLTWPATAAIAIAAVAPPVSAFDAIDTGASGDHADRSANISLDMPSLADEGPMPQPNALLGQLPPPGIASDSRSTSVGRRPGQTGC